MGGTQIDNNLINEIVEQGDFYGEWNVREGFWFFPEEENLCDELENALADTFNAAGINARFEVAI